jgi:hypothetical protein
MPTLNLGRVKGDPGTPGTDAQVTKANIINALGTPPMGLRTYHALTVAPFTPTSPQTGTLTLPDETNIEVALRSQAVPSGAVTVKFPANVPSGSQVKIVLGQWGAYNSFSFETSTGEVILADNYTNPQGQFSGRIYYFQWNGTSWVNITAHIVPKANWTAYPGAIDEIINKPSTFNPSAHTHAVDDVSNLKTSLEVRTGKTIFVDPALGTDTRGSVNKYSLAIPFATIAAAVSSSSIGDTIHVRAGNHAIAAQITLNGKGNLHFELGTNVVVAANVVAFNLTANEIKSITGYANFICSGTGGLIAQNGGTQTGQSISIQCGSIVNELGTGNVFNVSGGVVGVDATIIRCTQGTVADVSGSGDMFYRVLITYAGKLLNLANGTTVGGFTANCWTVQIFGPEGIRISSGVTNFRIVNLGIANVYPDSVTANPYAATAKPIVLSFAADSDVSGHVFAGGRVTSNAPCITFNSAAGSSNKSLKLDGGIGLVTGATNSITSVEARSIVATNAYSNKAAASGVTMVGNFSVNSLFY